MHLQLVLIAAMICQIAAYTEASQITELKSLYPATPLIHSLWVEEQNAGSVFALDTKTDSVLGRSKPTGAPVVKFLKIVDGNLAVYSNGMVGKIE